VYGVWLGFPLGIALKALAASVVFAQNKWARTGL
jgi:Na+-driven multidrug efflux pump